MLHYLIYITLHYLIFKIKLHRYITADICPSLFGEADNLPTLLVSTVGVGHQGVVVSLVAHMNCSNTNRAWSSDNGRDINIHLQHWLSDCDLDLSYPLFRNIAVQDTLPFLIFLCGRCKMLICKSRTCIRHYFIKAVQFLCYRVYAFLWNI